MNLTGKRFQCLTVLGPGGIIYAKRRWICRCDCGNEIDNATEMKLIAVLTNDCGCGIWRSVDRRKAPRKNTFPRPEDRPSYLSKMSENPRLRALIAGPKP